VVPVTAAVVADGTADVLGDGGEIGDEGLDGLGFEGGLAGDGLVEVVHVGLVMASVVDLHGGGVDVGFQGFLGIGKRGEFVRHTFVGQSSWKRPVALADQGDDGVVSLPVTGGTAIRHWPSDKSATMDGKHPTTGWLAGVGEGA